jgi:signal transduction histidine kinase
MDPNIPEKKQIKGIENIRFIYLIILAAILAVVIVNFQANVVWLRDFAGKLRQDAVTYESSQANHSAEMMEKEANQEIEDIETLARSFANIGLDAPPAEIFVQDFLKRNNHTREISLINLDGKEQKRYSREATFNEGDLRDFSLLEQFEKAKAGNTFVSRVNYTDHAEPYVLITTPVNSLGYGGPIAVIQAQYYLRGMWEVALETKVGNTGRISVFDDKGMLVADPQPSRVLKKINLLNLSPVRAILSKINTDADTKGVHYLNEKNVEVVAVAFPLDIRGMRWGVLVEQDASEIEGLLSEVIRWLVIFLVGNLIVISILVWLIWIVRKTNQRLVSSQINLEIAKDRAEDEKNKTVSIVSNFIDPVIVVDPSWQISMLNPAAKEIFGLSDNDIGKRINTQNNRFSFADFGKMIPIKFTVKELEKDTEGYSLIEEVIVGHHTEEEKLPQSALTGSFKNELVYKVITRSVCDADGTCHGHMKIFYDLTREKMVDRMKTDFISIVAHQLRTPLSAIKWAVGMVLDGDAGNITGEQANFLRKGYESNERMIMLVNDLLNVSRIEEGRFGFTFAKYKFQDALNDVIANMEGLIAKKHIKIGVEKQDPLPEVYMDKDKIVLALQNILDNAIKYTPDYGEIKITLKSLDSHFYVSIKDSGIGIPKRDQPRMFSKFFRSANVVKMQTEGSGLGLFIVKNIIEKHGGKITLTSEEEKGTEVDFILPLSKKSA